MRRSAVSLFGCIAVLFALLLTCACGGKTDGLVPLADAEAPSRSPTPTLDAGPAFTFFEEPCSDGPRWPGGTDFQYELHGPTNAPACTPHCGPNVPANPMWGTPGSRPLTTAALPSGPCLHEGNTCTMPAEWVGQCPPAGNALGPLELFICRCRSATWACTIDDTSPSATGWSCELPDDAGAPDAGP